MSLMPTEAFQNRPLGETDLDFALEEAGGARAHLNSDRRLNVGADYLLGNTLIELKTLDEEGFAKSERQQKIAALFQTYDPECPVIVVDRRRLNKEDRYRYDRIIEGPIKKAVNKANRQLKQSSIERDGVACSVLMVVNNGYTTLDHEALKSLVAHRVRQDTHNIDAVVVAGAYYHSDGFDGLFLWPIDYVPINFARPFVEFERLRTGWNALSNRFMTQLVRGELTGKPTKGSVVDTQFDVASTTYIRPAPIFGVASEFYKHGRPRRDSSGIASCPPVGLTFPALSRAEWTLFHRLLNDPSELLGSFELWQKREAQGQLEGSPLCPFVKVPITTEEWNAWCTERGKYGSIFDLANEKFTHRVRTLASNARDLEGASVTPSRYLLVVTDVIGQDRANDVSHIAVANEHAGDNASFREIIRNARIFHEHAVPLAAAYAIREGLDSLMYIKNLEYAWI